MSADSVVLIGAGSTVFTPGLLTDLACAPAFDGWTVHLVDLDAVAADTMARLGRRIAAERGARLTFVPHTDRREALTGARFVTTTIAVGGAGGWLRDVEIPARYDAALRQGGWAFVCEGCFSAYGIGLGTGRGQRLIVVESGPAEPPART